MNRRTFLKGVGGVATFPLLSSFVVFEGCSGDEIIKSLQTAALIAGQAAGIIAPVNFRAQTLLLKVSSDLHIIIKTYGDYEVAEVVNKPNFLGTIKSVADGVTSNLRDILDAVGVRNPELLTYISVAVAVVNSALVILANQLGVSTLTTAKATMVTNPGNALPVIATARSAKDLAKAWNNSVGKDFPHSKI